MRDNRPRPTLDARLAEGPTLPPVWYGRGLGPAASAQSSSRLHCPVRHSPGGRACRKTRVLVVPRDVRPGIGRPWRHERVLTRLRGRPPVHRGQRRVAYRPRRMPTAWTPPLRCSHRSVTSGSHGATCPAAAGSASARRRPRSQSGWRSATSSPRTRPLIGPRLRPLRGVSTPVTAGAARGWEEGCSTCSTPAPRGGGRAWPGPPRGALRDG